MDNLAQELKIIADFYELMLWLIQFVGSALRTISPPAENRNPYQTPLHSPTRRKSSLPKPRFHFLDLQPFKIRLAHQTAVATATPMRLVDILLDQPME